MKMKHVWFCVGALWMSVGGWLQAASAPEPGAGPIATSSPRVGQKENEEACSASERAREISALPAWVERNGIIVKTYRFPSFSDAVAFIVRISHPLEVMNHHPEIRNVYGEVSIGFTTHDLGNKIGPLDFRAARLVEDIASRLPQKKAAQP
jgi:4a-hydroxytetrahydrobiopterin dehydratase